MTEISIEANSDDLETCELCIIGAGIAGLNALFVASEYLGKSDKVILIDSNAGPGGMWTGVYDYSRLHQPHPMFTVGDIAWTWSKPKEYLAAGSEVEGHFVRCLRLMRERVGLQELFGHTVTRCEEALTPHGTAAFVECHPNDGMGRPRIIKAKRVIKAIGFDIPSPEPMAFSSQDVISTTPQRLSRDGTFEGTSAVYVVGGGKTGMDTAHALITRSSEREVTLLSGTGTVFVKRRKVFPGGARRWWDGSMIVSLFRDISMRYDGINQDEVFDYLRQTFTVSVDGAGEQFFFGILSEEERDVIAGGLRSVVNDYLVDVVDGAGGPEMVLRSGKRVPVAAGSVFVNCTGHLLRKAHPYEPYLSEQGAILAIVPRSMIHFLSSASAYFLTHLFFRGTLRDLPLYEFDGEGAVQKERRIFHTAVMSLSLMNTILMLQALPFRVVDRCGLDLDRWYPLPRRLAALIDLKLNGKRYVAHCRKALDRVREIHGLRCGPLAAQASRSRSMRAAEPDRYAMEVDLPRVR